ncbi:MAG TPA: hypothetical protein ENK57_24515 [Polyangiaceae bacterium]|nr:hypothetical protein [Polyangiaceae bacterium]
MPKLDAFSQQIVDLVRQMPDEAILELVKNQLGAGGVTSSSSSPARTTGSASAKPKKRATKKRGGRRTSAARQEAMAKVESVIKASKGLSASEIAERSKLPQTRVSSIVRDLKAQGRIYQGGDRRFARYAGDAKTAAKASEHARRTASGPQLKGRRRKKKAR